MSEPDLTTAAGRAAAEVAVARAMFPPWQLADDGIHWFRWHADIESRSESQEKRCECPAYLSDDPRLNREMWLALPRGRGECWSHVDSIDYHEIGRTSEPLSWVSGATKAEALVLALVAAGVVALPATS